MNLRPWVAAPLAGAAIALVSPSAVAAEQVPARHASGSLWLHEGDGHGSHHNPWRDCHSQRRVVLIDTNLRAILTNGRHGPEAVVLQGASGSSSSPAAPWDSFTVSTYLDVNNATESINQYEFAISDFFRVHPLFVVKAFDRHQRKFPFPAAHCDDEDDGDHEDRTRPYGGATADGNGSSGSPLPHKEDHRHNAAAGWSARLPTAKHVVIAAGGLLMVLGVLAVAWIRRRRSARSAP